MWAGLQPRGTAGKLLPEIFKNKFSCYVKQQGTIIFPSPKISACSGPKRECRYLLITKF